MPLTKRCPVCGYRYEATLANCAVDGSPLGREKPGADMLGPYRLVERLGVGGMGAVYRAVHVKVGRGVAVKLLHHSLRTESVSVSRFFREARAVNTIRHPNVVEVHDLSGDGEELFMVLELLKGRDLRVVLDAEPGRHLDPQRAVYILEQICGALQAAHEHNIVHRDLKPENIFLMTKEGRPDSVKLLDFGVAKLERPGGGRLTREGITLGTPEYMAPEQARGATVDGRTDLYAVGCMAYEMLTGRPVFLGDSAGDVMVKQVAEAPDPLRTLNPAVPEALEAVVLRCLAKDPRSRPQTGLDLAQELCSSVGMEFDTSGAFLRWKSWDGYSVVSSVTSFQDERAAQAAASSQTYRRVTESMRQVLRSRRPFMIGAAAAAVIVAGATVWALRPPSLGEPRRADARVTVVSPAPAPSPRPAPRLEQLARVLIQSSPAGAKIFDAEQGVLGVTPQTLKVAVGRELVLRFELDGYQSAERSVKIDAEAITVAVALEPDSSPQGARKPGRSSGVRNVHTSARASSGSPPRRPPAATEARAGGGKPLDSNARTINPF